MAERMEWEHAKVEGAQRIKELRSWH